MSWFMSDQSLAQHPAIYRLASHLSIRVSTATGHITHLTWCAMDHARNGRLNKFDKMQICAWADWGGDPQVFVDALKSSGAIDRGGRLFLWHEFVSKYQRIKENNRKRQQKFRASHKPSSSRDVTVTSESTDTDDHVTSRPDNGLEERRGEEKRREEKRVEKKRKLWGSGKGKPKSPAVGVGEVAGGESHTHTRKSDFAHGTEGPKKGLVSHEEWTAAARAVRMPAAWIEEEWSNQMRKKSADRWKHLSLDSEGLQAHAQFVMSCHRKRAEASAPEPKPSVVTNTL